ncbi:MAG: RNA methyltransferase [Candidatus Cloacimonetes bacterium]|nr:RNA methyltransferase [Candidatus Cloacimonadota bacterium]
MKYSANYSVEKFLSFSVEKQYKAIDHLILALEMTIGNEAERNRLISHIIELGKLIIKPLPDKMESFLSGLEEASTPHEILGYLNTYHESALRKDNQLSIRKGDGSNIANPKLSAKAAKIILICDNLRSVFNVGSIFRSAECLGIGQILLCGITPTPLHANMSKTAMGTESIVPWQHFPATEAAITYCRNLGLTIYALETAENASSVFETNFHYPLALIVGNESLGVETSTLQLCNKVIILPQLGWKNSLNVGVATAATLYQIIFGDTNG